MTCKFCGQELPDDTVICSGCGRALNEETQTNTVSASKKTVKPANKNTTGDKISIGGFILSVLFPIVGLIGWIINHKKFPKKGKHFGIGGIIVITCIMFFYVAMESMYLF